MKPLPATVAALLVGKTAPAQDVSSADPVIGLARTFAVVADGHPTAPDLRSGSRARRDIEGGR